MTRQVKGSAPFQSLGKSKEAKRAARKVKGSTFNLKGLMIGKEDRMEKDTNWNRQGEAKGLTKNSQVSAFSWN